MSNVVLRSIERMQGFPGDLNTLTTMLDATWIRLRPAPTSWSIVEIIGHLGDVERVMRERMHLICTQQHPAIEAFDQDTSVLQHSYQQRALDQVLAAFADERARTLAFLATLPQAMYARTGWHPEIGLLRVDMIIEHLTKHDYSHYRDIHVILRQVDKSRTHEIA
jgi:uncharacterized damage-inducible protein DinB